MNKFTMTEWVEKYKDIQKEAIGLFIQKNADYGDAFTEYGVVGVLVRIGDKIKRLQSIEKNKITLVSDEKIKDTLIDLHNYSAMAIMLLNNDDGGPDDDANNNNNNELKL
tara:strand:- start:469 stop:798 length:330 start_codon:yes stop_codon:yes gene_type:complete